jgi:hypothetical protein
MYFRLNAGNELVDNPMKKTLLALSHVRGKLVDDWVDIQHNWINEQNAPTDPLTGHVQVPSTSNIYWTHFITEFNQAFANSTEKQTATAKLHTLHMEGRNLDSYLAKFHTLAGKAGYGLNEEGTLNLLRRGLPEPLAKEIIKSDNPQTYNEWEVAAHKHHDIWMRLSSLYPSKGQKTKFGKTEGQWRRTFAPKPQTMPKKSDGVVPMQVDPPGWINHTLTNEEKTHLMKEGRCFRCSNKGHMSRTCPTRPPPSASTNKNQNKPQKARAAKVDEVEEDSDNEEPMEDPKIGVNQVINSINAMTNEEREDFLTKAFASKGF